MFDTREKNIISVLSLAGMGKTVYNLVMITKESYPIHATRLELSPYRKEFAFPLFQLKALKETHRFNYTKPMSEDEACDYIEEMSPSDYYSPQGRLELAIIFEGKFIGFAGLKGSNLNPEGTGEIFYTLHRDYFGRGFGYEVARGLVSFGFEVLRLHRIWAGATVDNRASWRIMEKLGMRRECRWVKDRPMPGAWRDGNGFEASGMWEDGFGYAVLREEWGTLEDMLPIG